MKKIVSLILAALMAAFLVGCAGNTVETPSDNYTFEDTNTTVSRKASDDDCFEWLGNSIAGLSEKGKNTKHIVFPAKAETIIIEMADNDTVESFAFEDPTNTNCTRFQISNFTALETVELPLGVTENFMFRECTALKQVTLSEACTKLNSDSFYNCSALESIVIPDTVAEIEQFAFSGCTSLKSIVLPASLTIIEHSTFYNCTSLERIEIPEGVTKIGHDAFWKCVSLAEVILPESLETIGNEAFYGCNAPSEIRIPENVSDIGRTAFAKGEGNILTILVKAGSWADLNSNTFGVYSNVVTY